MVTPAGKAFVDAVPFPVFRGQQSPLGATAQHPSSGFHKAPALGFVPDIGPGTRPEKLQDFRPLIVT